MDEVVRYHYRFRVNERRLKAQACAYIDVWQKYLSKYRPDVLICSGDSRMFVETLLAVVHDLAPKVSVWFFEQGPLGTTIIDKSGVNANCSFRDGFKREVYEGGWAAYLNDLSSRRQKKYRRNPVYRGADYVFGWLASRWWMPDLYSVLRPVKGVEVVSNLVEKYQGCTKERFLLVLQVPQDVNMIYHSPLFANHYEMLSNVYNALPAGCELVVREHPLYKGKYEQQLYDFINTNNLVLDNDTPLADAMSSSNVVVVNNSTVGIEAIASGCKVVVLGDSYYDRSGCCTKVKSVTDLPSVLDEARNFTDECDRDSYLIGLFQNCFIEGHFRDEELDGLAERILGRVLEDEL